MLVFKTIAINDLRIFKIAKITLKNWVILAIFYKIIIKIDSYKICLFVHFYLEKFKNKTT